MVKINVLAGGPLDKLPDNFDSLLREKDVEWIGVDAGAFYLIDHGLKNITSIGDFDSLTSDQYRIVKSKTDPNEFLQAEPEKDYTDTELALQWITNHYDLDDDLKINLFGMTGGRMDHELSNLLDVFLDDYKGLIDKIRLFDKENIIDFFSPGKYQVKDLFGKKYLGFVLLSGISHFSIKGAKYDLDDYSSQTDRVFASNEFLPGQNVEISFAKGNVLAIYS
ncbi:thiamine diphosphokinase [Oenococcus alcoholitolerans]|uniref:thiamine diphosphokinase n=1 Tax=Oenococcus alcoholitolerans TaxID=931074 RepID=UPI003F6E70E3